MIPAAVGIALVLAATVAVARHDHEGDYDWPRIRRSQLLQWLFAASVVGYVLVVEGKPLASLDPETGGSVAFATIAWAWVLVAGTGLATGIAFRLAGREEYDPAFRTLVGLSAHRGLFVAVTAGVTEEVVFRGYLLTRLVSLTGSDAVPVAVAGLAFAAAHAGSRSRTQVLQLAPMGLAFGVAFLWTGSLLAVVGIHVSYDVLVLATNNPEDFPTDAATDA